MPETRAWHKFAGGRKYHIITSGSLNPPETFVTVCNQKHSPTQHRVAVRSFEASVNDKCLRCKSSMQASQMGAY